MTTDRVRKLIADNFTVPTEWQDLPDDLGLVEHSVLDSLDMLTLVSLVEREFAIHVDDEDVVLDNFGTIGSIAAYVDARVAA
jgi:acyl carrier protein